MNIQTIFITLLLSLTVFTTSCKNDATSSSGDSPSGRDTAKQGDTSAITTTIQEAKKAITAADEIMAAIGKKGESITAEAKTEITAAKTAIAAANEAIAAAEADKTQAKANTAKEAAVKAKEAADTAQDAVKDIEVTAFRDAVIALTAGQTYTLAVDITLDSFESIPNLRGILDGNGKTITIKSINGNGLISNINAGAEVKNLKIKLENNVKFSGGTDTASGVLAGENNGKVEKVAIQGKMDVYTNTTGTGNTVATGGLIGKNNANAEVINCSSEVNIKSTLEYPFLAMGGGLIGENSGTVEKSHATGVVDIIQIRYVAAGGLIGRNSGTVEKSYATNWIRARSLNGTANAGGLIGDNKGGTVRNSYSTGYWIGGIASDILDQEVNAGGFIGKNSGTVEKSYSTATTIIIQTHLSTKEHKGRFVGYKEGSSSITSSYVLKIAYKNVGNSASTEDVADGVSAIEASTITAMTFTGWDATIWNFVNGQWPTLK